MPGSRICWLTSHHVMKSTISQYIRVAIKTLWVGAIAVAFTLGFTFMWMTFRTYAPEDELKHFEMPQSYTVTRAPDTSKLEGPQVINMHASTLIRAFSDDRIELLVTPAKLAFLCKKGDILFIADAAEGSGWAGSEYRYMGRGYYYELDQRYGVLRATLVSVLFGAMTAAAVGYPLWLAYQLCLLPVRCIRKLCGSENQMEHVV
jgi:hypothetical protein